MSKNPYRAYSIPADTNALPPLHGTPKHLVPRPNLRRECKVQSMPPLKLCPKCKSAYLVRRTCHVRQRRCHKRGAVLHAPHGGVAITGTLIRLVRVHVAPTALGQLTVCARTGRSQRSNSMPSGPYCFARRP